MKAGRVKVLGVTSARRSPVAPDLPPLAVSRVPGYDVGTWIGALALGAQPPPQAAILQALGVLDVS